MFRWKIALIVAGGALAFTGFQEWLVSRGTTQEPQRVELVDLEKNSDITNNHLKIGAHQALYSECVFNYKKESGKELSDDSKINHAYYPILSNENILWQQTDDVIEQYGDVDSVPDDEWPELDSFSVLVKTRKFRTYADILGTIEDAESVQGLVINRISSLDDEEAELIKSAFPSLDLEKVLILEEGRKPSSNLKAGGMMGGGGILILAGLGWLIVSRKK
ncbi:MAG: hypothetical protein JXR40_08545 [Pontiellaceae bacterium]|nr:hypothetical protein [Pontiellaceae bacterium]